MMHRSYLSATISVLALSLFLVLTACQPKTTGMSDPTQHVDWSKNATIYEVNLRQFSNEGTFNSFANELPRLQRLGVDILWLMPVHPIGEKNRKGSLGSYYAVKDYLDVNPEFGTREDFRNLVKKAHELGMKVIIDWVANHTSWDNELITRHPEWYKKDSAGNIIPPVADWTDVAGLDYTHPGLLTWMKDALIYWIREFDIDGYRCDVAGMLPVSFWHETIPELKKMKPVFMLAENESPVIHDSGYFDASYAWNMHHMLNSIARGTKTADKIDSLYATELKVYNPDAFRMQFTSNHDENSWNGTEYERLGDGAKTFAVFTFTFPGIPLIYTGQESGMNKRLRFFDKDTIPWGGYPLAAFYATLTRLKKDNDAIASGVKGGSFIKIPTTNDKAVYAFIRKNAKDQIVVVLNMSPAGQTIGMKSAELPGNYTEAFTKATMTLKGDDQLTLKPWEYLVLVRN